MNINEAVEKFMVSRQSHFVSDATLRWYGFMLKRFVEKYGHWQIERLDEDVIDGYVASIRREEKSGAIKRETARGIIRAMKNFTQWMTRRRMLAADAAAHIDVPKSHKGPPKALTLVEVRALLSATTNTRHGIRDRAMIYWLLDTGCRVGGLIGLRPEDVDWANRRALVTEKGGNSRWVPFTAATGHHLRAWLAVRPVNASACFCSLRARDRGATLTDSGVRLALYRLSKKAKISRMVSPHDLRHTLGTLYTARGGPSLLLRDVLGHSDVRTTQRYAQVDLEAMSRAHDKYSPVVELEALK